MLKNYFHSPTAIKLLFMAFALLTAAFVNSTAHASVNNFIISEYSIEFDLSKDDEGRSRLKTVETITAQFPASDQNHGIERAIPRSYQGHSTSLQIESVKKVDGSKWNYEESDQNDNLILRIGDADTYLHGDQTFVITYTQRDVTRYFADTDRDEFYWDVNGTQWRVPIEKLNVSLAVDENVLSGYTGDHSCYQGASGSTQNCDITKTGNTFRATATSLDSGENITLALGFSGDTFAEYQKSLVDKIVEWWLVSIFVLGAISLIPALWIIVKCVQWHNRKGEVGTIIPQYIPPADASVATAAKLVSGARASFAAQLLDFAVRHYIKIYQIKEKSLFRPAEYEVEIIRSIYDLRAEEQELFTDIFPSTAVGTKLRLKDLRNNTSVATRILDNDRKLDLLIEQNYAIRHVDPARKTTLNKLGKWLLVPALLFLNPVFFGTSMLAFGAAYALRPLTDKGLELYRYLEGLKQYISVAEKERLAMLQSPDGVAKVGVVNGNDSSQLLKLYERVLPYAVLFGQEKEWNKRIGTLYESSGQNPTWYGSNSAFNAAAFSSGLSSFSTAASYTSASSSSSGGSSGGGSSGGGGGGGGGGGW